MANGYGSSSSTSARQSTTNAQGQVAPPGFHYMPDGSLMSDVEHARLYGAKVIRGFNLDLSNIAADGESRSFTITGDKGAQFSLEIKDNTTGQCYNFFTNAFQTTTYKLDAELTNGAYNGYINFPAVTGSSDRYDVNLLAKPGTVHANYTEVRFADGTVDVNSSTGSASLVLQKIIYQYSALTLSLQGISQNSTVLGTFSTDTITLDRGKGTSKSFSITATAPAHVSYSIAKEVESADALALTTTTVDNSSPEALQGEDIYPAVTSTDTVDGDFTAGNVTKLVLDNDVVGNIAVGDKITVATADLTDTVDGAVSSGVKVVMDNNVATKMAVGDRVTGSSSGVTYAQLDAKVITVAALNPDGDNVKEFSLSEAVALDDGATLTFTPKCNRETFTVAALNPDEDNTKEFSYVDNAGGTTSRFGVVDGTTLSFSNQRNKQWLVADISKFKNSADISGTFVTANTKTSGYEQTTIINEGTINEETITTFSAPFKASKGLKPTITEGLVTAQPGYIIFDTAQLLTLKNTTITAVDYNETSISNIYDYDVRFTNLAIELTPITTTTTAAVVNSTTVPVASVNGILPGTTTVSGIGIDASVADPTVNSRSVTSGAGNIVLSAAQNLESGVTLTFADSGQVATITGNIEILKAGTADQVIYFDLEKLLTTT